MSWIEAVCEPVEVRAHLCLPVAVVSEAKRVKRSKVEQASLQHCNLSALPFVHLQVGALLLWLPIWGPGAHITLS